MVISNVTKLIMVIKVSVLNHVVVSFLMPLGWYEEDYEKTIVAMMN